MDISVIKKAKRQMNKGCLFGEKLLERSLKLLGFTRSVVVDKNFNILCGDKVVETAKKLGMNKIIVVETTGDCLVVVKRNDVDALSKKGLDISLIDNFCNSQSLVYDATNIIKNMNENLVFNPREWGADSCLVEDLDLAEYLKQNAVIKDKNKPTVDVAKIETVQKSLFD